MKRLSDAEIAAMVASPHLSETQRIIAKQFYVDKVRATVIGHRLGLTHGTVTSLLYLARQRSRFGKPAVVGRAKNPPLDAAWFQRQIDRVRQLATDEEHQRRYLNGIERAWGEAIRARVEAAA